MSRIIEVLEYLLDKSKGSDINFKEFIKKEKESFLRLRQKEEKNIIKGGCDELL